jgi:hypothetical protein
MIGLLAASACAQAQWLNHRNPGTPRLKDGKPNLAAPAPRSNGKPDLSGIWQAEGAPIAELMRLLPGGTNGLGEDPPSKYFLDILADFKPEDSPLRPAELEPYRKRRASYGEGFPVTRCLPAGLPTSDLAPEPFKIVQTRGLVVMLFENNTAFRQIFTDAREQLRDPQPSWMGYSVGKWEGDTLVVDTIGFNDQSWLDAYGHKHSDAMHLTERFRRPDFGHLKVQATIDDPKTFTKPFTIQFTELLHADTDLLENFCAENEKDVTHLGAK